MVENSTIKVMISEDQFRLALEDAGIGTRLGNGPARLPVQFGDQRCHGFLGTVATLASFMIAAQARFGPYDSEMIAQIVKARETGQGADRLHFYFPGLELY